MPTDRAEAGVTAGTGVRMLNAPSVLTELCQTSNAASAPHPYKHPSGVPGVN